MRLDFVALPTRDMNRAISFYQDVLGLRITSRWEDKWTEFDLGGNTLAVMDPTAIGQAFAPVTGGGVALGVDDVAATVQMIKAKGYPVDEQVTDTGVCHVHFLADPDGNALMLHHRYAPEA